MESFLENIIDHLRELMVETAMEKGSFLDEHVIHLSQQLDFFIYQHQLLKDKKRIMYMPRISRDFEIKERVRMYAVS